MQKEKLYKPFNKKTDYNLILNDGHVVGIRNTKFNYIFKIKPNGYIPRTGTFLFNSIKESWFKNSTVLDIGTGETGIFAIHSAFLGAKQVTGLDIDEGAVEWAKYNAKFNNLNRNIIFKNVDFRNYKPKSKLDIILSNPPQMPAKHNKSAHDDGGEDGTLYIKEIIKFSKKFLTKGGKLIFSTFDFLGVEKNYNSKPCIIDYLKQLNFNSKIISKQKISIKPNSYTFKNLEWIKSQYPKYSFKKEKNGNLSHYVFIILSKN